MAADTAGTYRLARTRREALNRTKLMQTVVKIGFVGAGGIVERHLEVLRRFPDVRIAAIADADGARAKDVAARYGAMAFETVKDMLCQGGIDALYICVPPFAHGPAERAAIAAGVPFFVEKPITHNLALIEALSD